MPRKNDDYRPNFDKGQQAEPLPPPPPPESDTSPPFNTDPNAPPDPHFDELDRDDGTVASDKPVETRGRIDRSVPGGRGYNPMSGAGR